MKTLLLLLAIIPLLSSCDSRPDPDTARLIESLTAERDDLRAQLREAHWEYSIKAVEASRAQQALDKLTP